MQKLFVESQFTESPDEVWEVFESEAFRDRLADVTGLTSKLLSTTTEGCIETRLLQFTSGKDLPVVAAKALGSKRLTYEQTNRWDKDKGELVWDVRLPKLEKRVTVAGKTSIVATPSGCKRLVDGTIEVKMRLIGGQIEKVVLGQFQKSMERAVELARDMLQERK